MFIYWSYNCYELTNFQIMLNFGNFNLNYADSILGVLTHFRYCASLEPVPLSLNSAFILFLILKLHIFLIFLIFPHIELGIFLIFKFSLKLKIIFFLLFSSYHFLLIIRKLRLLFSLSGVIG